MGKKNTIFGYISFHRTELDYNRSVLDNFLFDDIWPLPKVFNLCDVDRLPPVISFATTYFGSDSEWEEWLPRFEQLLGSLHAEEAEIRWVREDFGEPVSVFYLLQEFHHWSGGGNPVGQNRWTRVIGYDYSGFGTGETLTETVTDEITL